MSYIHNFDNSPIPTRKSKIPAISVDSEPGWEQVIKAGLPRRSTILTEDAPTITYSATAPATGRIIPVMEPNAMPVGCRLGVDGTITDFFNCRAAQGYAGLDFYFYGSVVTLAWRCAQATKERFIFYVDGQPVSLTPATPSVTTVVGTYYYVTLTFSAARQRRVEILGTAINTLISLYTDHASYVSAAASKCKVHIVADSFWAGSVATPDLSTLPGSLLGQWFDCSISIDAIGGSGFTSGTTYATASRVAHVEDIQPDDIIICGSVNDDGDANYQITVESTIQAYKAASPWSNIIVLGPPPSSATATISANRQANCVATRSACEATGARYIEMIGFPSADAITAFATGVSIEPDALVSHLGAIWRMERRTATSFSSTNEPGDTINARWSLLTAAMYGTGNIGATAGNGTRDTFLYSDSVHPTPAGCAALAAWIAGKLW